MAGTGGQRRRAGLAGRVGLAAMVLLGAARCGSSTTTPTTPAAVARTTDTFTGTVAVGGRDFHSFPITAAGTVDVTLTAATPPAAIVMGVSIGMPGNGICIPVAGGSTQTPAGSTVQLSGVASPGTLCVDVHDAGGQSAPVTYTVTVTHP